MGNFSRASWRRAFKPERSPHTEVGNGKSLFGCPLEAVQPCEYYGMTKTCYRGPLYEGFRLAFESYKAVAAGISGLSDTACPDAVFGRIVSIVVSAFNGVRKRRTRPHVLKEVSEGLKPPVANRNTPPAIVFIVGPVRVLASLSHIFPYSISSRTLHPVFAVPIGRTLAMEAAAAFGMTAYQALAQYLRIGPAVASTEPIGALPVGLRANVQRNEATKATPDKIFLFSHARSLPDYCGLRCIYGSSV